jgi:hypothetical protein
MATAAQVQAALDSYAAAISTGDYESALDHLLRAEGYLAGIPDGGASGTETRWRVQIPQLISAVRRRAAGNAGIQRTKSDYIRPTAS